MDKKELEYWRDTAREKGWDTCTFVSGGRICRGCHDECMGFGHYSENVWFSPKGGYYHSVCAIKRLKKEEGRNTDG